MIEYLYQEGVEPCSQEPLKVRLDGRIIGEIRMVAGGYQYFPKGQKVGGEILPTVTAVQKNTVNGTLTAPKEAKMELTELQHRDKCRWWDDEEFCDCGADTYEELQAAKKVIESLTAEKEADAEKIRNQRERISYLEGATNHACGTPLSLALTRAEAAEPSLAQAREEIERVKEERAVFQDAHSIMCESSKAHKLRAEAAEQREKGLREALLRYGGHDSGCNLRISKRGSCTCGFEAALAAASKEE